MFRLRIETKNQAFEEDNKQIEIVRILRELILRLECGNTEGTLHDINGNKVGEYTLTNR